MLCADLVQVRWRGEDGRERREVANLEDISFSGACLQMDEAVPLHAPMVLSHSQGELHGRVRYCVYREIGYFIGLQFSPGQRWNERQFRPQHLLDTRRLSPPVNTAKFSFVFTPQEGPSAKPE